MYLKSSIRNHLRTESRRWLRAAGCIPCEAQVKDWGCRGCRRPVVVVTFAAHGGSESYFVDECDGEREARKLAASITDYLDRLWVVWKAATNR